MALAPSIGIYIYNATSNFQLLFWLSLALALLGFVVASTVHLPKRQLKTKRPCMDLDHFFLTDAWLMAINISLFGLCWGIMSNYVAIYGEKELGITDGTGIFFAILAMGLVLSRLTGRETLRKDRLTHNCAQGVSWEP